MCNAVADRLQYIDVLLIVLQLHSLLTGFRPACLVLSSRSAVALCCAA
jgi:hypothetical protein